MKKNIKPTIIIIALCISLIVAFFAVTYFIFKDKISDSEYNRIDKTFIFTHSTEKGEKIEISFAPNFMTISEDTYLVDIVFNGVQNNNANYEVKNAKITLNINNNVNILSSFFSADGSSYAVPNISNGDFKKLECFSDKGYIHIQMLLSGADAKDLKLAVEYGIHGKQLYFFNKFHHTWENINPLPE
ncbi:MAG TPA: hypothetical protein DDX91_10190 [Ruminococcaceae bacterium]|nr:hypothetical protein [Oscillospiraceae bacterium]